MFQIPEKTNEENENKNEKNKDSNHIQNSSNSKIIMNNSSNNSINDNENINKLINIQELSNINKEMEKIALTGQTKLSWKDLKLYIKNFLKSKKYLQI